MHLILFDIDGTLVESDGFDGRLYVDAVREILNVEIDDDWSRYTNVSDSGVLDELLDGMGYDADRATGGWQTTSLMKLRAIGLHADTSCMASGSDCNRRTDIMALAEQRVSKGESISRRTYFGDGPWDRNASAQLGFDFIAIGNGVDHEVQFADFLCVGRILDVLGIETHGHSNR